MNRPKDARRETAVAGRKVRFDRMSLREREDLLEIRSLRMGFEEAYEREMREIRKVREKCRMESGSWPA